MGKLIVFWSPWHGQSKVTASLAATAVHLNQINEESVVVTHSQFGMANLEDMFNKMEQRKRRFLYSNSGLSAAILRFKQSRLTKESVDQCLVPITTTGLFLLPGTEQSMDIVQETDTADIVFTLLAREVPKHYDWVMVDALSGNNSLSMKLIEAADVVVVNLSQNATVWETFFKDRKDIVEKKNVFYILSGYEPSSKCNVKNFIKENAEYVKDEQVGIIPYNVGYMDAISFGSVARYLYSNEDAEKDDENYYFIKECKKTAEKIKKLAEKEAENSGNVL